MTSDEVVKYLSYEKAKSVARNISTEALIIGADTVVECDDIIMGKPEDMEDSFNMLRRLSSKWHRVLTGLCVLDSMSGEFVQDVEVTEVKIKELTDEEIWNYIYSGEPQDKAGSYAIQGLGSLIVEKINGCYFNVVGLPVFKLSVIFESFGINLLKLRSK
jgi:septum formation protein